jgi:outer membrane protein assembly factor BamE (lipoprotein component of BamABCDE complex)
MQKALLSIVVVICLCSSCIVKAPKFAYSSQVFELKLGMTEEQVNTTLGITPYSLRTKDDSTTVYVYKYRTFERTTLPFFLRRKNGVKTMGEYMDLSITFNNKSGLVSSMKSKQTPKEKKGGISVDVNSIFTLLTVAAPAALVYLGFMHAK